MKKRRIAWIMPPRGHQGCGLPRLGRLQLVDLINKAGEWLGHKSGIDFANNVVVMFNSKPESIEGMQLSLGLFDYAVDYLDIRNMPFAWGMSGGDGRGFNKMKLLLASVEDSRRQDAIIFGYVSADDKDASDFSLGEFLTGWEFESIGKFPERAPGFLIKIDMEAKTVEYDTPVWSK